MASSTGRPRAISTTPMAGTRSERFGTRRHRAIPPRITTASPGIACPSLRPVATSSTTANPAATEVFLARAMMTSMRGGITVGTACGKITSASDWPKVRPIARAASACPTPTELIPERGASLTKAEVYRVRQMTAVQKAIGAMMPNWGATSTMPKNTSVSGVLRSSST